MPAYPVINVYSMSPSCWSTQGKVPFWSITPVPRRLPWNTCPIHSFWEHSPPCSQKNTGSSHPRKRTSELVRLGHHPWQGKRDSWVSNMWKVIDTFFCYSFVSKNMNGLLCMFLAQGWVREGCGG